MLKHCLVLFTVLGAACATDKEDAKGVVDESQPPSVPSEIGKADASSKEIAVNVQSAHPYANNLNKLFSVPYTNLPSCASQIRVHFKVLRTEATYDFVTVESQSFDGDKDNTWTSWFPKTGSSVNAPPITYTHKGKQYVTVLSGRGGSVAGRFVTNSVPAGGMVWTFALMPD